MENRRLKEKDLFKNIECDLDKLMGLCESLKDSNRDKIDIRDEMHTLSEKLKDKIKKYDKVNRNAINETRENIAELTKTIDVVTKKIKESKKGFLCFSFGRIKENLFKSAVFAFGYMLIIKISIDSLNAYEVIEYISFRHLNLVTLCLGSLFFIATIFLRGKFNTAQKTLCKNLQSYLMSIKELISLHYYDELSYDKKFELVSRVDKYREESLKIATDYAGEISDE